MAKPRHGLGMAMGDVKRWGYVFTREKGYELLVADSGRYECRGTSALID